MVNIITTRNFRSLHSLKKGLMMGKHVKTTADRHYTPSEYRIQHRRHIENLGILGTRRILIILSKIF